MQKTIPDRSVFETVEYGLVADWYGESTAKRSGVPLINHIHEGLTILDTIGADVVTQSAFCLHPLLQHDGDFHRRERQETAESLVQLQRRTVLLRIFIIPL